MILSPGGDWQQATRQTLSPQSTIHRKAHSYSATSTQSRQRPAVLSTSRAQAAPARGGEHGGSQTQRAGAKPRTHKHKRAQPPRTHGTRAGREPSRASSAHSRQDGQNKVRARMIRAHSPGGGGPNRSCGCDSSLLDPCPPPTTSYGGSDSSVDGGGRWWRCDDDDEWAGKSAPEGGGAPYGCGA